MANFKWKPVILEGPNFTNKFAGLTGIQECTDYDPSRIIYQEKRKREVTTKKPRKKFKKSDDRITPLLPSKQGSSEKIVKILDNEKKSSKQMKAWQSYSLPHPLLKALEEQGFYQPTDIQAFTLPAAIFGRRDILGAAETGSGKTLAFGLPIINGIINLQEKEAQKRSSSTTCSQSDTNLKVRKPLYALILTPTRELAMQVTNHLRNITKYTGIKIAMVVGGMAAVKQERILNKGPEIVVGTPGRLWMLIEEGNEHLSQIDKIKFLAIDETDRMLERGHFNELGDLLGRINLNAHNKFARQNFVFSATLTLIHDIPRRLINSSKIKGRKLSDMSAKQKLQKIVETLGVTNPKIVDLSQGTGTSGTLTECRITCEIDEKDYYVYYFLEKHPGRTIIFCNSIGCVKRLSNLLGLLGCNPAPLHASMQQRQRLKNLERFRDTKNSILIATDVAARGLDIPKVDHVLHYQMPRTSEIYVHRSGRTARASKQGITVLIMEPNEFPNYIKLRKTLRKGEDLPIFPVQDWYLHSLKKRVHLARDLDKLELQIRKANSEDEWLRKAAKEMEMEFSDDEVSRKYDSEEMDRRKRFAKLKRKELATLLATPIYPREFSGMFPPLENFNLYNLNAEENAIDVMKSALYTGRKKKRLPLYKPKNRKQRIKKKMKKKLKKNFKRAKRGY